MAIGLIAQIATKIENERHGQLTWDDAARLPASPDETPNIGVAGAIVGTMASTLLIAGGANFPNGMPWEGGAKNYAADVYLYKIGTDGTLKFLHHGKLDEPMAYSGNCSVDGSVYVAGGENSHGAVSSVRRFFLSSGSLAAERLPDLPVPLANGGLAYASGKLYFVGGENAQAVSDRIYALDLSNTETGWEEFCALPYPVSHAVVASDRKSKLYIAGGRMRNPDGISTIYGHLLAVALSWATVVPMAELPRPTAAGMGMPDGEGNILLFGGDDGGTFLQAERLIAKIDRTTDRVEKQELIRQKAKIQREHPGFSTAVWSFSPAKKQWKRLADLPAPSPVATTALLHGSTVIIPSGEIRAGVRTDRILVGNVDGMSR